MASVIEGLLRADKRIASRYHYDERGSELFEAITRLDEYYPTRVETALLREWMSRWVAELAPSTLVELGAGNAEKTRIILDAMVKGDAKPTYIPVDVSSDFLAETARRVMNEYPDMIVEPSVADFTSPISLPGSPSGPRWIAFLGSTLGNFEAEAAVELLARIAAELRGGDHVLLGVDLRPGPTKSVERIESAYNDAEGITADFNLNVLRVFNAEFGTDFDVTGFRHRSSYIEAEGRIETYLESLRDQAVTFPTGQVIDLEAGESVRTEISCKYDRPTVDDLFERAGLHVERWVEDEESFYALVLGSATR